jgi:hypothetical protein
MIASSNFSTAYTFEWLKLEISFLNLFLTAGITKAIVLASTAAGGISELSKGVSLYHLIGGWYTSIKNYYSPAEVDEEQALQIEAEVLPGYWSKLKPVLIGAAVVDSTYSGLQNLNSVPFLATQYTNIDEDNGALKAFSIGTGIAVGLTTFGYTLQMVRMMQRNLNENEKRKNENQRLEQFLSEADSSDGSDDEKKPLLSASHRHKGLSFFDVRESFEKDKKEDIFHDVIKYPDDLNNVFMRDVLDSSSESSSDSESGYSNLIKKVGAEFKL